MRSWRWTISTSESERVIRSTDTSASPIGTSYDTSCAAERRPPSSEYLLFEDQPPRMIP